jgi:hypothetical protein
MAADCQVGGGTVAGGPESDQGYAKVGPDDIQGSFLADLDLSSVLEKAGVVKSAGTEWVMETFVRTDVAKLV